jgi:hypothetical protein
MNPEPKTLNSEPSMRTQNELNQFVVLRSNGWSLAKISKHLNIPKTTLFRWEEKNAETIHLFKYVQLEKLQEQYVPSYEEQLKDTHEHLAKIQAVLKKRDYSFMSSEFLLQMNFQLQNRLDKIREQVPLRPPQFDNPIEALPPIGCVTKDATFPNEGDSSDPDPTIEGEPPQPVAASRPPGRISEAKAGESAADHTGHANGNGKPHPNGHRNTPIREIREIRGKESNQNGTFRNENARGSKTDHCKSTTSNTQNGTPVPFPKDTP